MISVDEVGYYVFHSGMIKTIQCIFMDYLLVVQNTVHTLGLMSRTVLVTWRLLSPEGICWKDVKAQDTQKTIGSHLTKQNTYRERKSKKQISLSYQGKAAFKSPSLYYVESIKHKLLGEPVIMTIFSYPWAVTTILREKEKKVNVHNPMRSLSLCGLRSRKVKNSISLK